jgi:hypothetical protein
VGAIGCLLVFILAVLYVIDGRLKGNIQEKNYNGDENYI